jgi:hypothetical protein
MLQAAREAEEREEEGRRRARTGAVSEADAFEATQPEEDGPAPKRCRWEAEAVESSGDSC